MEPVTYSGANITGRAGVAGTPPSHPADVSSPPVFLCILIVLHSVAELTSGAVEAIGNAIHFFKNVLDEVFEAHFISPYFGCAAFRFCPPVECTC